MYWKGWKKEGENGVRGKGKKKEGMEILEKREEER